MGRTLEEGGRKWEEGGLGKGKGKVQTLNNADRGGKLCQRVSNQLPRSGIDVIGGEEVQVSTPSRVSSMGSYVLVFLLVVVAAAGLARGAGDPLPLQDFCVADVEASVRVNGYVCKDPAQAQGADFASAVMSTPGNASSSALGYVATRATAANFPGLNTHGLSATRGDFAVGGVNPPHVHPRASELIYVQSGELFAGFVSSQGDRLFAATLRQGELFIIPQGLLHFQLNVGTSPAVTIVAFSSQNPGTSQVSKALFASVPAIHDAVLLKSFNLTAAQLHHLRAVIAKI